MNSDLRFESLHSDARFDGWPSWSPDGNKIVFASERGDDADIYVAESRYRSAPSASQQLRPLCQPQVVSYRW